MTDNTPDEVIIFDADSVTVAQPTEIFVGTCPECKLPSRVEKQNVTGPDTWIHCLHCGADTHAERLWATETEGACDISCMAATRSECQCSCGGANHAGAYRTNRFKDEKTEKAIQRLIKNREKRAEAARKRREKRAAEAAAPFNEWLSSLNTADAALISWMRSYENVADAPTGILVDFRLRMMAQPGNEVRKPARPLTEKQMELAWKIVQRMSDECGREYDQKENGTPVPEGRFRVHGKVISRRIDAEGYGGNTTYKILLQCDGYRLWGNCPSDLLDHVFPRQSYEDRVNNDPELPADLYVEFNATVKQSDRDKFFGFFRNPRSAERSVPSDERKIPGLDITVGDAKKIAASRKRVSTPQSADEPAPSVATSTPAQSAPEKLSAPRKTGSHAECTHEATKSARAKCRRERQS